jgi:hypothetical protein
LCLLPHHGVRLHCACRLLVKFNKHPADAHYFGANRSTFPSDWHLRHNRATSIRIVINFLVAPVHEHATIRKFLTETFKDESLLGK